MTQALTALICLCLATVACAVDTTWSQAGFDATKSFTSNSFPAQQMNSVAGTTGVISNGNPASQALFGTGTTAWFLTSTSNDDDTALLAVQQSTNLLKDTNPSIVDTSHHFMTPVCDVFALTNAGTSAVIPVTGFGNASFALIEFMPDNATDTKVGEVVNDSDGLITQAASRSLIVAPNNMLVLSGERTVSGSHAVFSSSAVAFTPDLHFAWSYPGRIKFLSPDGQVAIGMKYSNPQPVNDDDIPPPSVATIFGLNVTTGASLFNATLPTDTQCPSDPSLIGVAANSAGGFTVIASSWDDSLYCLQVLTVTSAFKTTSLKSHIVWSQSAEPTLGQLTGVPQQFVDGFGRLVAYLLLETVLSPFQHSILVTMDVSTGVVDTLSIPAEDTAGGTPTSIVVDSKEAIYICLSSAALVKVAQQQVLFETGFSCSPDAPLTIGPDGNAVAFGQSVNGGTVVMHLESSTPSLRGHLQRVQ